MERVSRVHFKGLEAIELIGPNGKDKVAVTLHGAHICSWTKDTHEVLIVFFVLFYYSLQLKPIAPGAVPE
jgi:hypothetical protein